MNEMDSLLTTRQLQDLLQVDRITIYRMLNDGRLQGFKVGGQWRFSRRAIENWLQEQRASLGVVEPPQAAADLRPSPDTLPLTCIQAIQGIFAEALGLGTITTAVDGAPLTTLSNSCDFCNLVYNTDAGRQRCVSSWRVAVEQPGSVLPVPMGAGGRRSEGPALRVATCHAGLHYVWGRIEVQGEFVAATFAGQYLGKPPQDGGWTERIAELSDATGIDCQELREALGSVPVLDENHLHKVPHLLQRVTTTFSEIGEERLNLLDRLQRIAEITGLGN